LIFGERDALLVDALCTVREATALADWVALHDRRLTTICITHGHFDHWLDRSVLLERFPQTRAVAKAGALRLMRAVAERFELEERSLQVIETGHTDAVDPTALYMPDLGMVVSGDVVYHHCDMFVGDTTTANLAEWIAALDRLTTLNPATVVTGHKDPTCGNPPSVLAESCGYLEAYGQLREAGLRDQELFVAKVSRDPDRVSRQQLLLRGFGGRNERSVGERARDG
jgi:glyoxylase-like metal-dependent hydrolase (beta-lactamase superfamily II)